MAGSGSLSCACGYRDFTVPSEGVYLGVLQKETVYKLKGKNLVDLCCIVSITLEVAPNHFLQPFSFNIWPTQTPRVQQFISKISRECIAIPDPKMEDLMPPQKDPFQVQRGKDMVKPGHPLRHSQVIGILRLERKGEKRPTNRPGQPPPFSRQSTVRWNVQEVSVSIRDQSLGNAVVIQRWGRSPEYRSDEIVIQER